MICVRVLIRGCGLMGLRLLRRGVGRVGIGLMGSKSSVNWSMTLLKIRHRRDRVKTSDGDLYVDMEYTPWSKDSFMLNSYCDNLPSPSTISIRSRSPRRSSIIS